MLKKILSVLLITIFLAVSINNVYAENINPEKKSFWSKYKYWIIGGSVVAAGVTGYIVYDKYYKNNDNIENNTENNSSDLNEFESQNSNMYETDAVEEPVYESAVQEEVMENEVSEIDKININVADANELSDKLDIDKVYGMLIVKYRERMGKYNSIEDLKRIPGIEGKVFKKIKDKIKV